MSNEEKITIEDLSSLILDLACKGCKPYGSDGYTMHDCPVHNGLNPTAEKIKKILAKGKDSEK